MSGAACLPFNVTASRQVSVQFGEAGSRRQILERRHDERKKKRGGEGRRGEAGRDREENSEIWLWERRARARAERGTREEKSDQKSSRSGAAIHRSMREKKKKKRETSGGADQQKKEKKREKKSKSVRGMRRETR